MLIKNPAICPYPPGMFTAWQLQANLGGAQRLLDGQPRQPLLKSLQLLGGQPTAQITSDQFIWLSFEVSRQWPVGKAQDQIRFVAAYHGGGIFNQHPITFLALANPLGRQRRLGNIQPEPDRLQRLALIVSQ